jgi:Na+-transporting methylmalonyl-CoA/oxaloacetate decarboxylase gamma subunit
MPAIVIVLVFLVLFLLAFLAVLLGPFVGLGFAIWKQNRNSSGSGAAAGSAAQICK